MSPARDSIIDKVEVITSGKVVRNRTTTLTVRTSPDNGRTRNRTIINAEERMKEKLAIKYDDRVIVDGRFLVYENDRTRRFQVRGIAFPVPLPSSSSSLSRGQQYDDLDGWVAILQQLRESSPYLNTLRIYKLPVFSPSIFNSKNRTETTIKHTYSTDDRNSVIPNDDNVITHGKTRVDPRSIQIFLEKAAEYGFYVLLPLTSVSGPGVLDRSLDAPLCYKPQLYTYGTHVIDSLVTKGSSHKSFDVPPNVLGGIVGNEVMNSLVHWNAAPCVVAYARDLKLYMRHKFEVGNDNDDNEEQTTVASSSSSSKSTQRRAMMRSLPPLLPLIYTTQHDGIGAAVSPTQNVLNTLEYLTCHNNTNDYNSKYYSDQTGLDHDDYTPSRDGIDVFGINIESWCSSLQEFTKNEDGQVGTYWQLFHDLLHAANTVPVIFSEMGCSRDLFNRDNGLEPQGVRDWKQLDVVETKMKDLLSGFVAYTYDGPPAFRMTTGGPWDGHTPLSFDSDMEYFLNQLNVTASRNVHNQPTSMSSNSSSHHQNCTIVSERLLTCCNMDLFPVNKIPSYFRTSSDNRNRTTSRRQEVLPNLHNQQQPMKKKQKRDMRMYEDQNQDSFNVVFGDQVVPVRFPKSLATASLVLAAFVLRVRRKPTRRQFMPLANGGGSSVGYDRRIDYSTFQ